MQTSFDIEKMKTGADPLEICLVQDDASFRKELQDALAEAGFAVRAFPGSRELYAALLHRSCDIVLLDIGLPGEDGFAIAERLHALNKQIGIIMVTSRTATEDKVRALLGGADAYLVKPVVWPELFAMITSLARRLRHGNTVASASFQAVPVQKLKSWSLSHDGWVLTNPTGFSLQLSARERLFLQRLWQQLGETVSRDNLIIAMGEDPYHYDVHRLDAMVSRLRRKFADEGVTVPLRSVRGQGYVFVPASERNQDWALAG